MAEIKMDISEYELMKESKRLYEESLKKERELQKQIKQLTTEKIKALEDAKMKVVKISRNEVHEYVIVRKDWQDILKRLVDYYHSDCRLHPIGEIEEGANSLIDACFQKQKSFSIPRQEEIITYGLDEVKQEIRNELTSGLQEDIKNKLQKYEDSQKEISDLVNQVEELWQENVRLENINKMFADQVDKLIDENNNLRNEVKYCNSNSDIVGTIKLLLVNGYTSWNKAKLLNQIIKILK
jgi:hypothetical protein